MRKRICLFLISVLPALLLSVFIAAAQVPSVGPETDTVSELQEKTTLNISMPSYGMIRLEGDIKAGDRVRLYQREYRSSEDVIIDMLLSDTKAEHDGKADIPWYAYNVLSTERIKPDFSYHGSDVTLKALYGIVSDDSSTVRSGLLYTECFLETSVINQFYSTYHGSSACGPAAGVIAIQPVYPSVGIDMYDCMNKMRDYCMEGDDYCTGYPVYETVGEHITNSVNRYITEELSGTQLLTDHRTPGKSLEKTLIELVSTGRPAVVEVCYQGGSVTRDFWGITHWITINGFFLVGNTYWFRYSDPVTVSYIGISSDLLDASNKNVSYIYLPPYKPDGYIGAFTDPLFSIE